MAPASFIPWWLRISPAIWAAGLGLVAVLAIGGYLVMGGGAPGVPIVATSPTATIAATVAAREGAITTLAWITASWQPAAGGSTGR